MALKLTINGEPRLLEAPVTVSEMLLELGLAAGKVAVERNLEILPRSAYASTEVRDGDRYEIVRFIGGG